MLHAQYKGRQEDAPKDQIPEWVAAIRVVEWKLIAHAVHRWGEDES